MHLVGPRPTQNGPNGPFFDLWNEAGVNPLIFSRNFAAISAKKSEKASAARSKFDRWKGLRHFSTGDMMPEGNLSRHVRRTSCDFA